MDKAKAADIMKILVNGDFSPTLTKLGVDSYQITVGSPEGTLINTLKNFQDSNAVTIKARVVEIT